MKNSTTGIVLVAFLIIGNFVEYVARIKWIGLFVANKTFSGIPGVITMYIMEAIPTIMIFSFFGAAFYRIIKSRPQSSYWLIGYAVLASVLNASSTQWHLSEQVSWVRTMFEYSKVLLPMVFIYAGGTISKRIEMPPNKSL